MIFRSAIAVVLFALPTTAVAIEDIDASDESAIDLDFSETPSNDAPPPEGVGSPTSPEVGEPPPLEPKGFTPPVRFYGIIKPTALYGFKAYESFSQPNETAVTAAANPVVAKFPDQGRMTLQVAQSRLGTVVNEDGHYRAHIELDFWDPTKPNPSVSFGLRLRTLKASWVPSKHFAIEVGRDYEIHAPLTTHTINMVGGLLMAGNISQFRNQIKVFWRPEHFELGFSIGMQGDNNGPGNNTTPATDGNFELAHMPSFSGRIAIIANHFTLGVSGIGTQLIFAKGTPQERLALAYSAAFYFVAQPFDGLDIRFECYTGRNQNNIGLRGLGFGRAAIADPTSGLIAQKAADIDEAGGFISIRQQIFDRAAMYAIAGIADVFNSGDVVPDYARASDGTVTLTNGTTGPGIKRNIAVRLGYEFRPVRYFAFIIEPSYYDTIHALFAADMKKFNPHVHAYGIESGFVLTF